MSRFQRNAPAAVARRGGSFFAREIASGLEQMIYGVLPLVGVWWLGWSSVEMAFFFGVRMWVGILCDLAKLCTLYPAVMRFAEAKYDDWHVWVVAQAIRDEQNELVESHLRASYQPWQGVLVDLLFGGVATGVIVGLGVQSGGRELFQRLNSPAFVWSLVACCVYPVLVTVWQIARHRIGGHDEDGVAIASGGRGIALFLLMFVAAIAHEQRSDVGELSLWLMVAVSAAVILAGALNVFGYWLVKGETVWLGQYLEGKGDVAARR